MIAPSLRLELQHSDEKQCTEVVAFFSPDDPRECGFSTEVLGGGICAYCFTGVCVNHNDACFQCGFPLHPGCREEHAKESGHELDSPSWKLKASEIGNLASHPSFREFIVNDLPSFVDHVCEVVDGAK